MSYYKVLGFQKEPFSTSPDPDFFYLSRQHETALTNILIELRLKRGLSVILGDVGTGKTTLSLHVNDVSYPKKEFSVVLSERASVSPLTGYVASEFSFKPSRTLVLGVGILLLVLV